MFMSTYYIFKFVYHRHVNFINYCLPLIVWRGNVGHIEGQTSETPHSHMFNILSVDSSLPLKNKKS